MSYKAVPRYGPSVLPSVNPVVPFKNPDAIVLEPDDVVKPKIKVRRLTRKSTDFDPLLYDLLVTPTHHGLEEKMYKFLPTKGKIWPHVSNQWVDKVGNYIVRVFGPTNKGHITTLFSSHLDTVHNKDDEALILMITTAPEVKSGMVYAFKEDPELERSILGADDKLGVWIMIKMIDAGIPGLYIFHVGEECGGIGSSHIVKETPNLLKNIDRAIAFDRKNYGDIIQYQGGQCCSSIFSEALAENININLPTPFQQFNGGARGTWTDTANYVGLVQECTNVSVGYDLQHTVREYFDWVWLEKSLLPALLKVDWGILPTMRAVTPNAHSVRGAKKPITIYSPEDRWDNGDLYSNPWIKSCYVSIDKVTGTTPFDEIDFWDIEKGRPDIVSDNIAFDRMCWAWLRTKNFTHSSFWGKSLAKALTNLSNAITDITILEDDLEEMSIALEKAEKRKTQDTPLYNSFEMRIWTKMWTFGQLARCWDEQPNKDKIAGNVGEKLINKVVKEERELIAEYNNKNFLTPITEDKLTAYIFRLYSILSCIKNFDDYSDDLKEAMRTIKDQIMN